MGRELPLHEKCLEWQVSGFKNRAMHDRNGAPVTVMYALRVNVR